MWSTDEEYTIIENISIDELEKFLKENEINIGLDTIAERWAGFSNYYGRKKGLNDMESASFGGVISLVLGGLGVSAGTEYYYNEEAIENKALDIYNNLNSLKEISETEKKRIFFKTLFNIYNIDIKNYERKNHNINVRLSESEYQKFMSLDGEGKTDKFLNLLNKEE